MMFVYPVQGRIFSNFGAARTGHTHAGVDIAAPIGTSIVAAAAGRVTRAGTISNNAGLGVEIYHGSGYATKYFHCSRVLVSEGQTVSQGQRIAEVGATGNVSGPHLHFELWVNGVPVNPLPYLSGTAPAIAGVSSIPPGALLMGGIIVLVWILT